MLRVVLGEGGSATNGGQASAAGAGGEAGAAGAGGAAEPAYVSVCGEGSYLDSVETCAMCPQLGSGTVVKLACADFDELECGTP